MIHLKVLFSAATLLAAMLLSGQALAEKWYPAAAPAAYYTGGIKLTGVNMISCSTCHSGASATEDNVTTSFGVAFDQRSDDDNGGSLLTAYNTLAPLDSDGDGFSNQQESFAGSSLNNNLATPSLNLADLTVAGIAAKAVTGGLVANLTLQAGVPAVAMGGTATFISPYNSINPILTTTNFMFKAGGAQTGATVAFYDNSGAVIAQTAGNTTDSGFIANVNNGSVDVTVSDEGVFDLYSTAVFQADAIALSMASLISPYATVDNYVHITAKISPTATVEPYATIDAYAVVDAYATVRTGATIGAYAYIGEQTDVYANVVVDAYANVAANTVVQAAFAAKSGVGYVSAKFAVTTIAPTKLLVGRAAAGAGGESAAGGLHCMTSNLGTQALMFLGLLMMALLVRRKLN